MEEEGIVIAVNNRMVEVEVQSISCEKCDHFQICNPSGKKKVIGLENTVNAVLGDRVMVSIENAVFSRIALLVYGAPLLGLIAGYFTGERIIGTELAGIVTGASLFIVVCFLLVWYDRKVFSRGKRLNSTMVRIVK